MTTPPKSTCCEDCLKCPDYPHAGHDYCHDKNCPCHTQSTELEKIDAFLEPIRGRVEALHPQYFVDEHTWRHDEKGTIEIARDQMELYAQTKVDEALGGLTGEFIHNTFRSVQGEMTPGWSGSPWEELDAKSKKRYDYVALELVKALNPTTK